MYNSTIITLLTCLIILISLTKVQSQELEEYIPYLREPIVVSTPPDGVSRESVVNFKIEATIKNIDDGDTITLTGRNLAQFIIRLSDIDTPEIEHKKFTPYSCSCKTIPFRPGQQGGKAATEALKKIISIGDSVSAECYEIDIYGRIVCHIFKDDININLEMIKNGWGWLPQNKAWIRDPNSYKAEELAKQEKKGAWGLPGQVSPRQWRIDCWKNGKCSGSQS
jgi:endonuclease YncB( thermonuclease family)